MDSAGLAFGTDAIVNSSPQGTAACFQLDFVCALRERPEPWLDRACQQLEQLRPLLPNWDSYGALAVDAGAIAETATCLAYLARVVGVPAPGVGAAPDGEVALTWDEATWSLDASVDASGLIRYVYLDERDHRNDRETRTRDIGQLVQLLAQWT
jgi:hypothetical protein